MASDALDLVARELGYAGQPLGPVLERPLSPEQTHAQAGPGQGGVALAPSRDSISFGQFRLYPESRSIEKDGVPLELGSRAFDILTTLVEHAGEVVSQRDLMARVWRGLVVDPGNLRVHINSLRRALGDREGKERYIANVTGQGYCFIAPVHHDSRSRLPLQVAGYPNGTTHHRQALPTALARILGRDDAVRTIAADLIAERFVTIIGPGGIGKTTVAVSVAHSMFEEFTGAVYFVDLATVSDPRLVATTVASTLGLTVQSKDVVPALMLCLRSLRVLLVLDNCEHVIEAAAPLAERVFQEAPHVHILATSREAMRVEGEHVIWLPPLASPPVGSNMSAAQALQFPAVKLFVERAAAGGTHLDLTDADAAQVANICAGLDGIPLAIEFAAARVGAHGVAGTANFLQSHLRLQWHGRRTAQPRHQTLQSLLDWSYDLLLEFEKLVLRRLAVFVGPFTLEAAEAVARDDTEDESRVIAAIESLVAKSLVSSSTTQQITRFRLLETARVYALDKLEQTGEKTEIARRHANYLASLLSRITASNSGTAGEHLGNLRAALEWTCKFDPALAVELAASGVPVFLDLSLLTECHQWTSKALTLLDDKTRGTTHELDLQEALAISESWTLGNHASVHQALSRGLEIAQDLRDVPRRLRLLAGRHVFLIREAELGESLKVAEEYAAIAAKSGEPSRGAIADFLLGSSKHFLGRHGEAREHFERGLAWPGNFSQQFFGLDPRIRAMVTASRVMWLNGFPDRALTLTREAISIASSAGRPLDVCFVLLYSGPVFLWCGEECAAREVLDQLMAHRNWPALPSLHATAFAVRGALLVRAGKSEEGVALLREQAANMRANRLVLLLTAAVCSLSEALVTLGRFEEAEAEIRRALAEAGPNAEDSHYPEILRVLAHIMLSRPSPDEAGAEEILQRSLAEAEHRSALSWELRTAMTLAQLRLRQGHAVEGRQLLSSVHDRFTEGFYTADLRSARKLLQQLEKETQASPSPR